MRSCAPPCRTSGRAGRQSYPTSRNPTNAGYYLASVSDKIYMTPHQGGMNMLTGISSQMFFLKDILSRLGVNVQLIRHGKYKSAGETWTRNSPSQENIDQNKALIDSIWDSWADEIAMSRGISKDGFNSLLDRLELNFPEDYVEAGLVDELLTLDQLKTKLMEYAGATSFDKAAMVTLPDYITP